jgi:hypothetical protein
MEEVHNSTLGSLIREVCPSVAAEGTTSVVAIIPLAEVVVEVAGTADRSLDALPLCNFDSIVRLKFSMRFPVYSKM